MDRRRQLHLFALSCGIIALASCAGGQWGVLLWPQEASEQQAGQIVRLVRESQLRDTYTLRFTDRRERIEVERWRLRAFASHDEALEYAAIIAPNAEVYARNEYNALPIRVEQDRLSQIVYRLHKGEIIKVLERSLESSDEAGFVNHWYRVFTSEGIEGWVFGYYLTVFDRDKGIQSDSTASSAQIYDFLNTVWRPEYYHRMIDSAKINLRYFRIDIGLFPTPQDRHILLALPEENAEFRYETVVPIATDRLEMRGTTLEVDLLSEDRVRVRYWDDEEGTTKSHLFRRLNDDVATIINREQARHEVAWSDLLDRGTRLRSRRHGTFELFANKRFRWRNRERISPDLLPPGTATEGQILFGIPISDTLADLFDGALSMRFDGGDDAPIVVMIYRITDAGVEFFPITDDDVDDYVITRLSSSDSFAFSF